MKLIINNNKTKIECSLKLLIKLREDKRFCRRAQGAFFTEAFRKRVWDGMIRDITEGGMIDTGKVPQLLSVLEEMGKKVKIEDNRNIIKPKKKQPKIKGFKPRDYQQEAIDTLVNNSLYGTIPFPRGLLGLATNAGKTLISAMIYKRYNRKTLYLLNSKDLFEKSLVEIPEMIPGKVGWMSSKEIVWNDFMVVMVPTAKNRLTEVKKRFPEYPIVLVDEGDLATSKSFKIVLDQCYNAYIKIALSGSFGTNKDPNKNETIRKYFGEMLYSISNKELIEKGHSSDMRVKIMDGNTQIKIKGDYAAEVEQGLINSLERNKKILRRAIYHSKKGRVPMLILTQTHRHIEILYKMFTRSKKLSKYKIDWVHHKREGRKEIQEAFSKGEIDILIGSMILKRGLNFPLMRYICNAGGGDSKANILQGPIGRASRSSKTKKRTYIEDFWDQGAYLRRHSRTRLNTYKEEKLRVIEDFKKLIKL